MNKIFTKTLFIGKKTHFVPICHSTNQLAAELCEKPDIENGTLVITDFQQLGKGQRGNSWESKPKANLTISLVLEMQFLNIHDNFYLNIITSLALYDTLTEYLGDRVKIKWPNDIYIDNRKIAGILIENFLSKDKIEKSIIGIGLNVNQVEFKAPNATSLALECNQGFDREAVLELLLKRIEQRYLELKKGKLQQLRSKYLKHFYWIDEVHVFQADSGFFNGRILGINDPGKLHVELESGEKYFDLKEIEFIR